MSARTVIVTGGTGGLGLAVVAAFEGAGDRVVVPWIVAGEAERVRARFPAVVLVEADVADEAGAATVVRVAGDAAVLVNGVGGFAMGAHHETALDVWDRLYRMNVRAAAAMSRAALPAMLARGAGAIVNVAAGAALDPPAQMGAYAASKAALVALTRSLAHEVAPRGVRVNAVLPSTMDTPANRAAMPDADPSLWTRPADVAAAMLWLASDAAHGVRGALVPL
jgi:NAD(P)-dependent dehydrogenase (short-subunit alcohol dehydrogenase family)